MQTKPVIFLTFANDRKGRFLEALRPEQDGINFHLAPFQKNHNGIVYNAAASGAGSLLEGLNQFTGQLIIFHFSGHSDGQNIQLAGEGGEQIYLNGENLTQLLTGEAKENLKLVVLNACLSKGMLEAFRKIGVPAIIATESTISDAKAKAFAVAFYRSLASGNTLETAFLQSKALMETTKGESRVYSPVRGFEWEEEVESAHPSLWGLFAENEEVLNWRITTEGNITSQDKDPAESVTSRWLRIILFIMVPFLAIGGTYLWYQNQVLQQPFNLKVLLDNQTPSEFLPEPEGTVSLTYGSKTENLPVTGRSVMFENIPPRHKKEPLTLRFEAEGFETIDTSLVPEGELLVLPVRRNQKLAQITGQVYIDGTEPLEGLEGVKVSIPCCSAFTDASGAFTLKIPFEHQRTDQRIELFREGYHQRSFTETVNGTRFKFYLVRI